MFLELILVRKFSGKEALIGPGRFIHNSHDKIGSLKVSFPGYFLNTMIPPALEIAEEQRRLMQPSHTVMTKTVSRSIIVKLKKWLQYKLPESQ